MPWLAQKGCLLLQACYGSHLRVSRLNNDLKADLSPLLPLQGVEPLPRPSSLLLPHKVPEFDPVQTDQIPLLVGRHLRRKRPLSLLLLPELCVYQQGLSYQQLGLHRIYTRGQHRARPRMYHCTKDETRNPFDLPLCLAPPSRPRKCQGQSLMISSTDYANSRRSLSELSTPVPWPSSLQRPRRRHILILSSSGLITRINLVSVTF